MRLLFIGVAWHSIAILGMDERRIGVLDEVRQWLERSASDDSDEQNIPCLAKLEKVWTSKPKKKVKLKDDSFLNVQLAMQHEQKKVAQKIGRKLYKDSRIGRNFIQNIRILKRERAKKSKTGLFYEQLRYYFFDMYVVFDSTSWYLFHHKLEYNPCMTKERKEIMNGRVREENIPALSLCTMPEHAGYVFTFVGKDPFPMVSFCDVLAITHNDSGSVVPDKLLSKLKRSSI